MVEEEVKQQIIRELAQQKKIEELVDNITKTSSFELDDLVQDIYVNLLEYDAEKLIKLYESKQLIFFIVRMIYNNYFSKTSRYYYKYKKFINNCEKIEDLYDRV